MLRTYKALNLSIRKDQKAKFHDQILNIPVLWSTGWLDNGIGLRLFSASLDSWLSSSSLRIVLAITGELEGFFCKVFVSSNGIKIYQKLFQRYDDLLILSLWIYSSISIYIKAYLQMKNHLSWQNELVAVVVLEQQDVVFLLDSNSSNNSNEKLKIRTN